MKYEYCGISLADDIKDIIEKFDILKIEYKDSMKRLYNYFNTDYSFCKAILNN